MKLRKPSAFFFIEFNVLIDWIVYNMIMVIVTSVFNASLWTSLLTPLLITLCVEFIVIYMISKTDKLKLSLCSIPLNLFTNISMNLLLYLFFTEYYWIALVTFEILIVFTEALYYRLITKNYKISLMISIAANVVSLIIGLIIL